MAAARWYLPTKLHDATYLKTAKIITRHSELQIARQKTQFHINIQGGSNMTGTGLCVNKPHCAAAVRP